MWHIDCQPINIYETNKCCHVYPSHCSTVKGQETSLLLKIFKTPKVICSHVASLDMTEFQTCDSISQVGKIITKIVEEVTNIHIEYKDETICYECGLHSLTC
jgi:hypothetical protein